MVLGFWYWLYPRLSLFVRIPPGLGSGITTCIQRAGSFASETALALHMVLAVFARSVRGFVWIRVIEPATLRH